MAFRFYYPDLTKPVRTITAAAPDVVPVRGTLDGTAPIGTRADILARDFYRSRMFLFCRKAAGAEEPAGTADVQVWFRDAVEIGEAQDVAPSPPVPTDVAWVKGPAVTAITHLEELIIEDTYKRAVYFQITAIAGGGTIDCQLFAAPFDRHTPFSSVG